MVGCSNVSWSMLTRFGLAVIAGLRIDKMDREIKWPAELAVTNATMNSEARFLTRVGGSIISRESPPPLDDCRRLRRVSLCKLPDRHPLRYLQVHQLCRGEAKAMKW